MSENINGLRPLFEEEINTLKNQGCFATDWSLVFIDPSLDLKNIVNVFFKGDNYIHEGAILRNIPGGISGATVKKNALIENVASIEFEPNSTHGVGTMVSVLDETGSRAIPIYPGLSSQLATLMARMPEWLNKVKETTLSVFLDSRVTPSEIGENAQVKNCGKIKNVSVGREVIIDGASRLENGSIINNAAPGKCFTFIGSAVEAENFILEDGRLESKSEVSDCYIGQGTVISHGFNAHHSLFFANCTMDNGESHSLLAGPYTVSMHKGTLLIGCQTSFLNAGSLTNQSNHMYKLGPIHWGIMERGVKTSSGSYLMLGAKIGAFSLLMGSHKTHPDSSEFPFSHLYGEERGATVIVPGVMLRSCGLVRDEKKWQTRDKRANKGLPLFDHITLNVFSPYVVDRMLNAIDIINDELMKSEDYDRYMTYKGLKFTRASFERAKNLYTMAVFKYLSNTLPDLKFPESDGVKAESWMDLGGQIIPRSYFTKVLNCDNITDAETILSEAFINYKELEIQWIGRRFGSWWRARAEQIKFYAQQFDDLIDEDRQQYLNTLSKETQMLSL